MSERITVTIGLEWFADPRLITRALSKRWVVASGAYRATLPLCHCERDACPPGRRCRVREGQRPARWREHLRGLCHGDDGYHVEHAEWLAREVLRTRTAAGRSWRPSQRYCRTGIEKLNGMSPRWPSHTRGGML